MAFPSYLALDDMRFEPAPHMLGAADAHADEADAALGEAFDRRHADALGRTARDDIGFRHGKMEGAAHDAGARLAAARASLALV